MGVGVGLGWVREAGCSGVPLAESAVKVVSETSVGAIVTTITLSAFTVASLRRARSSSVRVARTCLGLGLALGLGRGSG